MYSQNRGFILRLVETNNLVPWLMETFLFSEVSALENQPSGRKFSFYVGEAHIKLAAKSLSVF